MYEFEYVRAQDLAHATALLAEHEESRPLAGGMSLVPAMKHRLSAPTRLIDLNGLETLRFVSFEPDELIIGAMTRHDMVSDSPDVRTKIPALATLAGGIGDVQVRHRGTIGGSLANNDPGACYPAAVLGLGATVHTNVRTIASDDFFTGIFETALNHSELITRVSFPVPDAAAYIKFHNLASRFSIVGIFVARFGGRVRVAVTGASSQVFRASALEEILSRDSNPSALNGFEYPDEGLINDVHGTAEYRAHLIPALTRRAVEHCLGAGR